MSQTPIYTPVERLDGLLETTNLAEKWMHQSRYRLVAARLQTLRRRQNSLSVLDIACGLGYGSKILAQTLDSAVTAIDIEAEALDYARQFHADARVQHQLGSILEIPAADAAFDAAVCFETIEHVDYQQAKRSLRELYRVLQPGGKIFISTPNRYFTFLLQMMKMKNPFHLYEFRPEELAAQLRETGFETQRFYGQTLVFPVTYYLGRAGKLSPRLFFPRRALPSQWAMISILEARKPL